MKIVIATGIFPPEVGGPATYAEQLGRQFALAGHDVVVVTYAARDAMPPAYPFTLVRVVRGNRLFSRLRFFWSVYMAARDADLMYLLDWFAAGVPASVAARWHRVPYVVRIGGDYFWEQRYLPSGAPLMPLRAFYEKAIYERSYKGSIVDHLIRFVLRRAAHVVFNSDIQRDLYVRFLGLSGDMVSTIWNPVPRSGLAHIRRAEASHEFVYWGRLIVMKNIDSLVRAFAQAKLPSECTLAVIGDGPERGRLEMLAAELGLGARVSFSSGLPRQAALERVKNARAFVLPSWTDVAPNQVVEALSIGIPCIVTNETFLPPGIRSGISRLVDPASVDDIAHALEEFGDDAAYRESGFHQEAAADGADWDAVAAEYLALGERLRHV